MLLDSQAALDVVATAVDALSSSPDSYSERLEDLAAPIYVTDTEGTITYYNKACVELAGRTPKAGLDKWCVTWKIFTPEGEFLPHDQCPMAVAIREGRAIRNVEAVAERPDVADRAAFADCDRHRALVVGKELALGSEDLPGHAPFVAAGLRGPPCELDA